MKLFKPGEKAECHFTEDIVDIIAIFEAGYLIEYPDGTQQVAHESTLNEIKADEPEYGKRYSLCKIAKGKTWAEAEVK
jgi:hypothetical protein